MKVSAYRHDTEMSVVTFISFTCVVSEWTQRIMSVAILPKIGEIFRDSDGKERALENPSKKPDYTIDFTDNLSKSENSLCE